MFEGHDYKKQARMQLANHWKTPLQIMACSLGISILISVTIVATQYTTTMEAFAMFEQTENMDYFKKALVSICTLFIIAFIQFLIYAIITMAQTYFSITFVKNNNAPFNIFLEGFAFWSKGVRGYAWMNLWIFLWGLLFSIPGIVKSIAYSQIFFVMVDNPKVGVLRSMKLSMAMTKGHKGELFIMGLSFIGWMLLASLPSGIFIFGPFESTFALNISTLFSSIGYLWLTPYILTSFTYAYHYMKKDAINRKVLTYADFGQEEPVKTIEKPAPAIEGTVVNKPTV